MKFLTACCIQVIDLGTQRINATNRDWCARKIMFTWEVVGDQTTEGRTHQKVYKAYDMRLTEGSELRQDLQSWFGDEFNESNKRFDLKSILGKYCLLALDSSSGVEVVGNQSVQKITPLSSDLDQNTLAKPLTRYGIFMTSEPDMDLFDSLPVEIQEQIKNSPEYVSAQDRQSSEDYD
ncbi:phage replication initiation protein, NGO0469 family [Limnohabitans sp.]|uniref:phage replication initiation protein, NGO0469 family n=1 Tax=Limnohabitans sp. TaxID=1907725 RepID=UPI0038BCBCCA